MSDISITVAIMIGCAALLIVWDIYVVFFNDIPNDEDSESGILRKAGSNFVALPIMWGVLGGHFWGPSHEFMDPYGPLILTAIVAAISAIHYFVRAWIFIPTWVFLGYVIFGSFLGALLWAQ